VFTSFLVEVQSIVISLSICLYVSLSVCSHLKTTAQNILYMLTVAVACSFSDGIAMCYVLPVVWMVSCFHVMGPFSHNVINGAESKTMLCFVEFVRWWYWGQSLLSTVALFV